MTTHTLVTAEADLVYDVQGPLPTSDGRPVLMMVGQPLLASGFSALASYFPDRTILTYDPRGLGRSTRRDSRTDHTPESQAHDIHMILTKLDARPVEMFASSGGAVTALALVATFPDDVSALVAHEPPLLTTLPDAQAAARAWRSVESAYETGGWGSGMAAFIAMTSWEGEFTDDYFAAPPADPATSGLPTHDDGSRDDPMLSKRSAAVGAHELDPHALAAASTRIVIAVGEETGTTLLARTATATATALGGTPIEFPSHHAGFMGEDSGYPGKPEAFAARLRDVLANSV